MSTGSKNVPLADETLSALVDGEADMVAVAGACAAWRESASTRSTWHAFHLIGDVMRSEDLASTRRQDAAFLGRLRERLANEPVVLVPQPAALPAAAQAMPVRVDAVRARRWPWGASAAVAAGFVAVAGVLVVTRVPTPAGVETAAAAPTGSVAALPGPAATPTPVAVEASGEPETLVLSGKVLRDARLDRYLAAHKQFAGSSALGVPSSFLRSATADAANR